MHNHIDSKYLAPNIQTFNLVQNDETSKASWHQKMITFQLLLLGIKKLYSVTGYDKSAVPQFYLLFVSKRSVTQGLGNTFSNILYHFYLVSHWNYLSLLRDVKSVAASCSGCWRPAPCPVTHGLCPGWGMQLLLSPLQVQPAAKLSTCPREILTDRPKHMCTGHWHGWSQGCHTQDTDHTSPSIATSPPLLGLAQTGH